MSITVTVQDAKRNLDALIAQVVSKAESAIITTEKGQMPMVSASRRLCFDALGEHP